MQLFHPLRAQETGYAYSQRLIKGLAMLKKRLFLASSSELNEDRKEFEIFINRKNKDWVTSGVFLELIVWEDFLDAVSKTRLQDEYNKAIRECDLFVMLFCTRVGQYTEEEFETAFGQFKATHKPFIFTYFKDAPISTGTADKTNLMSLWAFQEKLKTMGHFYTVYKNIDELKYKFNRQLDKLAANGFIELTPDRDEAIAPGGTSQKATVTGGGAIAQGRGAKAVGAQGVLVGGNSTGDINTGTQIDTGGGAYVGGSVQAGRDFVGRDRIPQGISRADWEPLFARLLVDVAQHAPTDRQAAAVQKVEELKAEIAKGGQADDPRLGKLVDGLIGLVPQAIGAVVSLFATPILSGIAGPVTKYVLEKLKGN